VFVYIVTDTLENYRKSKSWYDVRDTLEGLAEDTGLVVHYKQVSPSLLEALKPWAICHSGCSTRFEDYDVLQQTEYRDVIRTSAIPQLGLCGGHQLVATFFGSRIGPMRRLRADEPDLAPYRAGYFKEWGMYPVRILKRDPLFKGFGKTIRVQEYHFCEVKKLGPELELLASTRDCRVQAFRHRDKPVYGTQFHPESATDTYPDGRKVLKNFFALARAYRKD